jgi:hypothetical protein
MHRMSGPSGFPARIRANAVLARPIDGCKQAVIRASFRAGIKPSTLH